jgi:hypothetical protein
VAGRKEHVAGSSSLAFANLVKNCLTMAAVSSNVASSRSSVSPSDLRMANPAGFGEAVRYNSFLSFRAQSPDQVRADAARLERVIARDSEALAELYDEHGRRLFGLILRILKRFCKKCSYRRGRALARTTTGSDLQRDGSSASRGIERSIACAPTRFGFAPSKRFRNLLRQKARKGALQSRNDNAMFSKRWTRCRRSNAN